MPNSFRPMGAKELLAQSEREAAARVKDGKPLHLSPAPIFDKEKDEATVYIYDAIGGWWGIDPREWVPAFAALKAKTIHLRINSPGGSVFDAETIRTAIKQHSANVIAHIDGYAASAATGVAIAANEVEISEGGFFMIHNAWGLAMGRAEELRDYADLLDKVDSSIVAAYVKKSGQEESQVRDWMDKETWFTAAEAMTHGFVDKIFEAEESDDAGKDAEPDDVAAMAAQVAAEKGRRERALMLAEIGL